MSTRPLLIYVLPTTAIVALVLGAILGRSFFLDVQPLPAEKHGAVTSGGKSDGSSEPAQDGAVVTLGDKKLAAAAIQIAEVKLGSLTHTHIVPGRVIYNDNRHVEVTSPTSGILTRVLVKPGDVVEAWQVLAWLNSPEIPVRREAEHIVLHGLLHCQHDEAELGAVVAALIETGRKGSGLDGCVGHGTGLRKLGRG